MWFWSFCSTTEPAGQKFRFLRCLNVFCDIIIYSSLATEWNILPGSFLFSAYSWNCGKSAFNMVNSQRRFYIAAVWIFVHLPSGYLHRGERLTPPRTWPLGEKWSELCSFAAELSDTVVEPSIFYYHLTTIHCRDLPRFAEFVRFSGRNVRFSQIANRGKTSPCEALEAYD